MIHVLAQGTKCKSWLFIGALLCLFTSLLGASPSTGLFQPAAAQGKPKVLATTSIIADIAKRLAGDDFSVSALMGEGIDPHLYKASPGDMRRLYDADLILFNGLHLEGKMADVLEKIGARKPAIAVTSSMDRAVLRQPAEFAGNYDPHVWFDVDLWKSAANEIAAALTKAAPTQSSTIATRLSSLREELSALHSWCKTEIQSVPKERRVLVTAHDAFGYFGRAYDIEVLAIQGMSTDSEASLQDINHLVQTLASRRIPAVFIESSVPQKTIQALVEGSQDHGHNVVVGGELFSDALGAAGSPEGTYIGMIKHNVKTIVAALRAEEALGHTTP
jgi:manganese/zinc/iron transport system substrate-binding protein